MGVSTVEILCAACGADALLKREPRYNGFKKVGETLSCAACGHVYPDEAAVPFKAKRSPAVFADDDRPPAVHVFRDDEKGQACRYCRHYLVNPFTQRCSLHQKTVEATDWCERFERKVEPSEQGAPEGPGGPAGIGDSGTHAMTTDDQRELIATFFDAAEVAVAQEALRIVGIVSTVQCQETEAGDEYSIYVSGQDGERGATVMEEVASALARKTQPPAECGMCRSKDVSVHRQAGVMGEHIVQVCNACGHAAVRGRG